MSGKKKATPKKNVLPPILDPLQDITLRFSENQLAEINKFFEENSKPLFSVDGEKVNAISVEQLQSFLKQRKFHRRSFYYPSYAEVMKEVEAVRMGTFRLLTQQQFVFTLDKWVRGPNLKHELNLAFQVFDSEKRNFLTIDELKTLVTTLTDPFDEAETLEFLRDANVRGDGNIYYKDFVESIFDLSPELNDLIKAEYLYLNADEDPSIEPEPEPEPEPELEPSPPSPPPPPVNDKKGKDKAKGKKKK